MGAASIRHIASLMSFYAVVFKVPHSVFGQRTPAVYPGVIKRRRLPSDMRTFIFASDYYSNFRAAMDTQAHPKSGRGDTTPTYVSTPISIDASFAYAIANLAPRVSPI